MDPSSSQQRGNSEHVHFPFPKADSSQHRKNSEHVHFTASKTQIKKEYKMFPCNQHHSRMDGTRKLIAYQNHVGEENDPNDSFKTPKIHQSRQHQISIGNASLHSDEKHVHDQMPHKKVIHQNRVYNISAGSSYICRPVNNKRDAVRINDVLVKDNLILCCKPRIQKSHYMINKYEQNDAVNVIDGTPPQIEEKVKEDFGERRHYETKESLHQEPLQKSLNEEVYLRQDHSSWEGSILPQDHVAFVHKNPSLEAVEAERKSQCTKLSKRFKNLLWALFFINIFLVIIGTILLMFTLSHFISRSYVNIVIEKTGFVVWAWFLMIVSVFIVIVAIYGIITSIDRGKITLMAYCLLALFLAVLILFFLVFLWGLFGNMKAIQQHSMQRTFRRYRCNRHIKSAWDDLQESYKCCGVEDQRDWKYIPPSCCNGTTKQEKLACVKHYITEENSYSHGCKYAIQAYFSTFYAFTAWLLVLAFLLLVLGILACLWLQGRYKKVEKCQEVYYISR